VRRRDWVNRHKDSWIGVINSGVLLYSTRNRGTMIMQLKIARKDDFDYSHHKELIKV
jgi:hypothetical protein